jgi:hypothetical protein
MSTTFLEYTLPNIENLPVGTMKCKLFLDLLNLESMPWVNISLPDTNDGTFEATIGGWQDEGNHTLSRTTVSGEFRTGVGGGKIVASGAGTTIANSIWLNVGTLVLGQTYRLRLYAKSASGTPSLSIQIYDSAAVTSTALNSSTWVLCEHIFTATANDVNFPDAVVCMNGATTAYVDDITFDHIIDLAIPTMPFISIGDFVESVDLDAGIVDFENVDLEIVEDYSTYPEGFWFKIINGYESDVQIMFSIMEGTDETFLFRGSIYRDSITYPELYIGATTVRGVKIKLVSCINGFKRLSISDLWSGSLEDQEIQITPTPSNVQWCVKFKAIFASVLSVVFGVEFDEDNIIVPSVDINIGGMVTGASTTWWLERYVHSSHFSVTATPELLLQKISNCYELITYLCSLFGAVPKYSFGDANELIDPTPANNTHKFTLLARGRSYATNITPSGTLIESELLMDTFRKPRNIFITSARYPDWNRYSLNGIIERDRESFDGLISRGSPPSGTMFDLTIENQFDPGESGYNPLYDIIEYDPAHPYPEEVSHPAATCGYWWNYLENKAESYELVDANFTVALVSFLHQRFCYSGRTQFTRKYNSIKANDGSTSSHRWMHVMRNHEISYALNGSTVTKTYYATEVTKNVNDNTATVVWVEI